MIAQEGCGCSLQGELWLQGRAMFAGKGYVCKEGLCILGGEICLHRSATVAA